LLLESHTAIAQGLQFKFKNGQFRGNLQNLKMNFAMAERSKAPDWGQRSKVVGSIPAHPCRQFLTPDCKKMN